MDTATSMSQREHLMSMWQECFGDDPEWVQNFFALYHSPDTHLAAYDRGQLVAQLHLLPAEPIDQQGKGLYIYGVCTLPQFRSHGFGRQLIHSAVQRGLTKGYEWIVLYAATHSLSHWYSTLGFNAIPYTVDVYGDNFHDFYGANPSEEVPMIYGTPNTPVPHSLFIPSINQ